MPGQIPHARPVTSFSIAKEVLLRWYFGFFFVSGFCSVLYELVWLRLAMAQFGVTTALVSMVLSVFMAGLGLGSWGSGRLLRKYGEHIRVPARLYALIELLIGVSAIVVPYELACGRNVLEQMGGASSLGYYFASGVCVALALIPWCALMGATIPVAMQTIGQSLPQESARSFSFLYMANVIGAVAGTVLPLFLIEVFGFRGTLNVGAALNGLLTLSAFGLTLRGRVVESNAAEAKVPLVKASYGTVEGVPPRESDEKTFLVLLFMTGLTSMGMEVVWIRQFTPYLGTVVYAFASILAVYLTATFVGSRIYRRWSRRRQQETHWVWILLGLAALLPLITASPVIHLTKGLRLALGIAPFTGMLGFITPMLVERWASGSPARAGSAYAINVAGCILGPLLSGFLLLPFMSERWAMFVLAAPWLVYGVFPRIEKTPRHFPVRATAYLLIPAALVVVLTSKNYEEKFADRQVLRDHTATIIATGNGLDKRLRVNGIGITSLTPVTKMMAHMPLAFLDHPPQSAMVICFGMGTTFRSLLTWDIRVTAVELVPSVPKLFWYYHSDGPELLRSPLAHVVIDDGRRYLERAQGEYDVITIDPPPPVEAAGSSLLYSKEFYAVAKRRLRPGGILQQWLPRGDAADHAAVARALKESFVYVRVFRAVKHRGYHFLASDSPIPNRTAPELVQRMSPRSVTDLMEWGPEADAQHQFAAVLASEYSIDEMIAEAPGTPALQDDRAVNEYYSLRRWWPGLWKRVGWN